MNSCRLQFGFSLVELSIVLVILGLLTGGILAGQSLIRAAELRSITVDYNRFNTAVLSFRDKYMALPGDMPNAVRFWGAQAGATADGIDSTCDALTTGATSAATCNGNGNGMISYKVVLVGGDNAPREGFRAWQHLANTGLIEGSYAGIPYNAVFAATDMVPGFNVPRSKISNAVWGVWYVGQAFWNAIPRVHYFAIGSQPHWNNPLLSVEELWNIDSKIDDGKPFTGKVVDMATPAYSPDCEDYQYAPANGGSSSSDYNLSFKGTACIPMFVASF